MRAILLSCLLFVIFPLFSQRVVIDGEYRPRGEYAHGVSTLSQNDQSPSVRISQRTRLNFSYSEDRFSTYLSLQDVRWWGSQAQLTTNEDFAVSVHEAWGVFNYNKKISAKIGRQELVYDNHRIFGNVGWAQQGRSHDLFLLRYSCAFDLHVGVAHHNDANAASDLYTGPDAYHNMQFLWFHTQIDHVNLSFLFLNNGVAQTTATDILGNVTAQTDKYTQTFGPYMSWKQNDVLVEANAYVQTGKTIADQSKMAYEFLVDARWQMQDDLQLGAGIEWLSGTAYDELSDDNTFSPLYGTNHKFNGFMDYFHVGNDGNNSGLVDALVRGKYVKDRTSYAADIHAFWSAKEIAAAADNYLGLEVDLTMGYSFSDAMKLSVGYAHLFAGESMELIKIGGDADATHNWAYLMLTFKPSFFSK